MNAAAKKQNVKSTGLKGISLPGTHVVRRTVGAETKVYIYAWRGGPRLKGETRQEIEAEYRKVIRIKTGRTPRRPRIVPPTSTEAARRRACAKAVQNARVRAMKKGMDFYLTTEDLFRMGREQDWSCAVCGLRFNLEFDAEAKFTYNPFGISIDRFDCAKGYYPANIRLVITAVNFGLNDWGEEIFIQIAKAIARKTPDA